VIASTIAKRYARALLLVARDSQQVDLYGNQLKAFAELGETSPIFLAVLSDNHRDADIRKKLIGTFSAKLDLNKDVTQFLKLLVNKGRMSLLPIVSLEYQKMADAQMNRVPMTVVSAGPLADAVYNDLMADFGKKTGKTMLLQKVVDEQVLGGVRVHVGDTVYDYTVKNQLDRLSEKMMG
jgi:F-type H+-transporting ATPase subunit delta